MRLGRHKEQHCEAHTVTTVIRKSFHSPVLRVDSAVA